MRIVENIKLKVIQESSSYKETLCEVYIDGLQSAIFVRGQVLEEAIQVDANRYLIFTTDDVIFEESLNIYLIEIGRGVLDKLWIGQPYNTDIYSGCTILDENSLSFSFLYLRDWKLTVYSKPGLRLSIASWLFFFQGFSLFRYLTLRFMPNKSQTITD